MEGLEKVLRPLCYAGSSKMTDNHSLGDWTSTIQTSHRLWSFYYSTNENTVYRGYRENWHSNTKYQFDVYQGDDDEVFDFDLVNRNINLTYMHIEAVPVDIAHLP